MSEPNTELVRRLYAMITVGDPEVAELLSPDIVVDFSRRLVDPVVLRGRDQLRAVLESGALRENWSDWPVWEPEEILSSDDRVLAFIRFAGRGRASGIDVEVHVANLWTFAGGVPVSVEYLGEDRAAALEAAGLAG
jgi:ketosteroid isomerase-like protein